MLSGSLQDVEGISGQILMTDRLAVAPPTGAGDGDQLGENFRSPFAGALTRPAGAQAASDLIRHMKNARRSGEGLAPIPSTNRLYRPRRRRTAVARRRPARSRLRLGCAKALGQDPADSRGFLRPCPSARAKSLNSRLVGGAGSPARTRLSAPKSLILGKIQGNRATRGSAGPAILRQARVTSSRSGLSHRGFGRLTGARVGGSCRGPATGLSLTPAGPDPQSRSSW